MINPQTKNGGGGAGICQSTFLSHGSSSHLTSYCCNNGLMSVIYQFD